ncbi:unnamed protein product [Penicillium salamii]|uniref:Uncharacterized protein n=1 Tax=Penicillium salamii TaxID=1612424 RepID=A0A9W4NIA2_9EURO|nr:unnamed protein product [Penicillium salamii]CAG7956228.1 unnamed protein product [Penicillium salamii]CAG7958068.1 unnamed protein product [Penicillium salamii]CAG8081948.1 unnamed protein product [Penicillium salamii]CAG8120160.1 unnamed protein product [Penicillium salamii]
MTYHLLCRWQTELEFFLYQFCKTSAPGLIDDCHWSCPEAAELTRLSEEITEFFCFHHKTIFKECGISEQERESFCCELQEIRQIRHFAVHRVDVNAATTKKYAKYALNVLSTIKRLGGQDFEKDHGEAVCPVPFSSHYDNRSPRYELQLDRFVNSFWETEGHLVSQTSSHDYPSRHTEHHIEHNSREAEGARLRETQRAEHSQKQQDDTQPKKAKQAEHSQKQQDDTQPKKAKQAEHSQKQQDGTQPKKAKQAEHSQKQQDGTQPKKAKQAEHSQKQQGESRPKKHVSTVNIQKLCASSNIYKGESKTRTHTT